jgi:hypothetical protein
MKPYKPTQIPRNPRFELSVKTKQAHECPGDGILFSWRKKWKKKWIHAYFLNVQNASKVTYCLSLTKRMFLRSGSVLNADIP